MKLKFEFIIHITIVMLIGIVFTGCNQDADRRWIDLDGRINESELRKEVLQGRSDVLHFGFDFRGSPQEDARQYLRL